MKTLYFQDLFRENFEAALEWELTCLQETGLTVERFVTAVQYAKWLVNRGMRHGVESVTVKDLNTPYNLLGGSHIARRKDGHVEIDTNLHGLVGVKQLNPRNRRLIVYPGSSEDAKKVASTFQTIMAVDLKPFVDLQARRLGRPSVNELHEPVRLPDGSSFFHAYEVGMRYRVNVPLGMMPALYAQSKKSTASYK
ncbi:MAG: hypothetical protein HY051_03095 [Candidatus Aenigmarchaeota archaeon]|nr:hypothetical protein [Candidatus Aenigmarchaeota archaeon]